jgi:hypothetical protein
LLWRGRMTIHPNILKDASSIQPQKKPPIVAGRLKKIQLFVID